MKHSLIALSLLFDAKVDVKDNKSVKIDIAIVGKWEGHSNGAFEITAEDLQQIKENFDSSGIDVVIDYEHMTLWGEKAPAAGWIKSLEISKNTLLAEVMWLKEAKKQIQKGEYRYISPVLEPHYKDQVTGEDIGWTLHSAALTNKPFLEELGEVKAAKNQANTQEEKPMTKEEQKRLDDMEKELQKLKDANKSLKEKNEELLANSVQATIESAIAAKKITTDQKEWALKYCKNDAEGFADFIKNTKAPTQVPPNNQFAASQNGGNASTTAIAMSKV